MNFKNIIGMVPLAISLSSNAMDINSTELKFSENDIKERFIDVNLQRISYLNDIRNESRNIYLKQKFQEFENSWTKKTRYFNFIDEIINDVDFQNIIKMGDSAIPFILESINEKPSHLVWALNIIKDSNISQNKLTVSEACKAWVKWGKSSSII